MSKERLEEIKEEYEWAVVNGIATRLTDEKIEWLIERVSILEKQYSSRLGKFLQLDEQNKCYREAFDWIIENSTDKYAVQASYEALESDPHD